MAMTGTLHPRRASGFFIVAIVVATSSFASIPRASMLDAVPRELLKLVKPRSGSESWWEARFAESAMPDINEPASDPKHPFTFPLAVITATGWPRFAWHTEERHAAWAQARMDAQKELAASSTKSHHVLIGSNHYVQLEHPQTVIEAIQFVVSAAATP